MASLLCLVQLLLLLLGKGVRGGEEILTINNGVDKGDWGPIDRCNDGAYGGAFRVKYDQPDGLGDDMGLTGIQFMCYVNGTIYDRSPESLTAEEGLWLALRQCNDLVLMGVRADVEGDGVLSDRLGIANIQMMCSDFAGTYVNLDGVNGAFQEVKKLENVVEDEGNRIRTNLDGREMEVIRLKIPRQGRTWSEWALCSSPKMVCGLKTRIDDNGITDKEGLTDLEVICCE